MFNRFTNRQNLIQQVWEKGIIIEGIDKNVLRLDNCGALIKRNLYNEAGIKLSMAWEIDRIKPETLGGSDELNNLQPLQWENNRQKDEKYPLWSCIIRAVNKANSYMKNSYKT